MQPRTATRAVATLLAVVALAGCSGSDAQTSAGPGPARPTTPSVTAVPPSTAEASSAPAQPSTPATTAGALGARSVPAPLDLGAGWRPFADPGEPEEGYLGNGSWVRARGVDEVVAGIVPLGCVGLDSPPRLPVPAHALEATYRGRADAPAVALVLDYRTVGSAAAMLTGLATIARSCPAPAERVRRHDPLTVVVRPERIAATTVLDRRREYGVDASPWTWSEAVVRRGTRVGLLIVASDPAGPAPDLADLAARLRSSIVR